ncbi:hypothetical protein [Granulicatella sp. zg-ZJ]|uniref:hypothetical protein n=1 Tax=Granulicatella sp. zg-ZJ TaxID=2678504 RepID=UPI0013CFCBCE|nr:hypothetical protein [Granulicatella sp. zg-ZJ]
MRNDHLREKREFICKKCGKKVVTLEGLLDRRTVFCSALCSRRYWRHSTRRAEYKLKHDQQENNI